MEIGPKIRDGRRKPEDDATLRRLADRYSEGLSIRDLCRETGWGYGTVHQRLSMAQVSGLVVLRPRGGISGPRGER
jgi:predicted transcriptional regulator